MEDTSYLVCIGLIEQEGKRHMPLGGKSLNKPLNSQYGPGENGKEASLELLLRVMERSEKGLIKQVAGKESFLLLEIPLQAMQEELPKIKVEWIAKGNHKELISNLNSLCKSLWSISFRKHEGVQFTRCF